MVASNPSIQLPYFTYRSGVPVEGIHKALKGIHSKTYIFSSGSRRCEVMKNRSLLLLLYDCKAAEGHTDAAFLIY